MAAPNTTGPSPEARARSAQTRRRQADERLAKQLRNRGWLVMPPEAIETNDTNSPADDWPLPGEDNP